MESMYRTGNETVDQLSQMRITGNVIPSAWYQTIRRDSGKPYLNAIVILSDIVYWYRAAEVRSEGTGELLGYKKRFKADLLQRSYQQIADQFGISKRDASNAIVELEKLGVVKRVFRKLNVGGIVIPNVLFLALDVEVLKGLTFPEDGGSDGDRNGAGGEEERGLENTERGAGKEREERKEEFRRGTEAEGICGDKRGSECSMAEWIDKGVEIERLNGSKREGRDGKDKQPMAEREKSNEEMENYEGEVSPKEGDTPEISDTRFRNIGKRVTDFWGTNTEITYKDYNTDSLILSSHQGIREEFKRQIEYDILKHDLADIDELDELVEIAAEVLTSTAHTIRVNREERKAAEVKERYKSLTMLHVQYVLRCMSETAVKIRNIRAVMITALYNASSTISTYYGNLYRYHAVGAA